MFVRWKTRKSHDETRSSLSAFLVQSIRINGKPRQKVLAFLGTLSQQDLHRERAGWWCQVEEKLAALNMDEQSREQVLQALAHKTPRPCEEVMRETRASRVAWAARVPAREAVPAQPPLLEHAGTTPEQERLLFIIWRAEGPWKARGKDARYTASLAKRLPGEGKPRQEIITCLGSLEAGEVSGDVWGWKAFWYQVHCALCLAHVDRETYDETMRLLAERVKRPTAEEFGRLLKAFHRSAEQGLQWQIERNQAQGERLLKKRFDQLEVSARSASYLGN